MSVIRDTRLQHQRFLETINHSHKGCKPQPRLPRLRYSLLFKLVHNSEIRLVVNVALTSSEQQQTVPDNLNYFENITHIRSTSPSKSEVYTFQEFI